jgi:ribosomal protein S18 acetylase RimI-like enzyme
VRARREQGHHDHPGRGYDQPAGIRVGYLPELDPPVLTARGDILIARDRPGNIAGTLLLAGPGAGTVFAPMPGPAAGTIGCVGVAPPRQGHGIGTALVVRASEILRQADTRNCHIG